MNVKVKLENLPPEYEQAGQPNDSVEVGQSYYDLLRQRISIYKGVRTRIDSTVIPLRRVKLTGKAWVQDVLRRQLAEGRVSCAISMDGIYAMRYFGYSVDGVWCEQAYCNSRRVDDVTTEYDSMSPDTHTVYPPLSECRKQEGAEGE